MAPLTTQHVYWQKAHIQKLSMIKHDSAVKVKGILDLHTQQ